MPKQYLTPLFIFILVSTACGGGLAEETEIASGQRAATAEPAAPVPERKSAASEARPSSGDAPEQTSAQAEQPAANRQPENQTIKVEAGAIPREGLRRVLQRGIARFLQQVPAEPFLARGRFVGWRITALYAGDDRFADSWIKPGDTVVRVNGLSIERPENFKTVWDSLYTARELVVLLLREGRVYQVRYAIAEQTSGAEQPAKCVCKKKRCKCAEPTSPSP